MRTIVFGLLMIIVGAVGALIMEPLLPSGLTGWVSDTQEEIADQSLRVTDDLANQSERFSENLDQSNEDPPEGEQETTIAIIQRGPQNFCALSERELFWLEKNGEPSEDQVSLLLESCEGDVAASLSLVSISPNQDDICVIAACDSRLLVEKESGELRFKVKALAKQPDSRRTYVVVLTDRHNNILRAAEIV